MVFNQTSAPTGWTKDTTASLNDSIMRIVTGTVASGGATAFSTFNGQSSVGATTLTLSQLPSHNHAGIVQLFKGNTTGSQSAPIDTSDLKTIATGSAAWTNVGNASIRLASEGSGGSHTHTITTNIKYNDFIICQKD